jgi:PAS domain-containing protein
MDVLWLTAGLGCDGGAISITAATQPGLEELMFGALPWVPKIKLHNPFLAFEVGDSFLAPFYRAAEGKLSPFILVVEGSVPNERNKQDAAGPHSGAEEALQEERNFASAVLDTVCALVLVLDPHGRIVRFNRACERTTGYASSEVIGGQVWDLFVAPEAAAGFRLLTRAPGPRGRALAGRSSGQVRCSPARAAPWKLTDPTL